MKRVHGAERMRRTGKLVGALALAATLVGATGCAAGGRLSLRSAKGPEKEITGRFTDALYAIGDRNQVNILLIAGDPEAPEQVVHIRQFWTPVAGSTPIDRGATNASVRYVVFRGEEAGVYAGAGFLFPADEPGGQSLGFELRQANLRLRDATDSFERSIRLAVASGDVTARLAPGEIQQRLRTVHKRMREVLGYPALVRSRPTDGPAHASRGRADERSAHNSPMAWNTPTAWRNTASTPMGTR